MRLQKSIWFIDFFCFKMFYPPKGCLPADYSRGPIVFTYVLFWVKKRILDFQFRGGFLPFWKPANVLSPGGTLRSRARKGSNCFYFTFYWCRKRYRGFQFTGGFFLFDFLCWGGGCQEPTFESTKQPQCPSGGPVITFTKTRPKAESPGGTMR